MQQTPNRATWQRAWPNVPNFYTAVVLELRRHKARLSWPHWMLDERAGCADGHSAKALSPTSNSGRMATHSILDLLFEAMCGKGYRVIVVPAGTDLGQTLGEVLDQQEQAEAVRLADVIDLAANTNRVPRFA